MGGEGASGVVLLCYLYINTNMAADPFITHTRIQNLWVKFTKSAVGKGTPPVKVSSEQQICLKFKVA